MKTNTEVLEKIDVDNAYSLATNAQNVFGTQDVRIVLPSGIVVSKAKYVLATLSDGSEIFEVHVS